MIATTESDPQIKVRLETEVTPALLEDIKPDTLICALGAKPLMPAIPGIDLPHVIKITETNKIRGAIGSRKTIIGGGLSGCEEGLLLAQRGKKVTIIEMQNRVAKGTPILHLKALHLELAKVPHNLSVLTNSTPTEITKDGVHYLNNRGIEQFLPADTVIISVGMVPPHTEIEALRNTGIDNFIVIGDSLKPGKVLQAVHGGYFAGKNS